MIQAGGPQSTTLYPPPKYRGSNGTWLPCEPYAGSVTAALAQPIEKVPSEVAGALAGEAIDFVGGRNAGQAQALKYRRHPQDRAKLQRRELCVYRGVKLNLLKTLDDIPPVQRRPFDRVGCHQHGQNMLGLGGDRQREQRWVGNIATVPVVFTVDVDRMMQERQARGCKYHICGQFVFPENALAAIAHTGRGNQQFNRRFGAKPRKIYLVHERVAQWIEIEGIELVGGKHAHSRSKRCHGESASRAQHSTGTHATPETLKTCFCLLAPALQQSRGEQYGVDRPGTGGHHEVVLGQWIGARGVAKDVNVIVKGGHTPYCTPRAIAAQLDISLARLGLAHAPIYIMHRDNPDVPVGEFIDALNQMHRIGKIGIFGGSNWSPKRFAEGSAYARKHGLQPMSVLNNNLSLAVMEKPVWDGCVTSNSSATLKFLRDNNVTHISWSSQARGFFLPEILRNRLPADVGPETCYGSPANEERRRRAEALAKKHGVSTHNIATAWVLAQTFPSFAIIGPRSPGEIATTLPALGISLSDAEVLWLNLEFELVQGSTR